MTPREEYNDLLNRISQLPRPEKVRLQAELTCLIRSDGRPKRSIMELEGLGKEIWDGIDAQDYVNEERDSWYG